MIFLEKVYFLMMIFAYSSLCAESSALVRWVLNEKTVYRIVLSPTVPTTITFPGALQSIDGVGITTGRENELPGFVLLAFTPNSNYFTLRGLVAEGKAALNITFQGKTYAFDLVVTQKSPAYRCVELKLPSLPSSIGTKTSPQPSIANVLSLLNQAKAFSASKDQVLGEHIEHVTPRTTQKFGFFGEIDCILDEIFRFKSEEALVFHVRLINRGLKVFSYIPHPTKLGVRVGERVFLANVCDASGVVAPSSESHLFFTVLGDEHRTQMDLDKNRFQILLSEPQYGVIVSHEQKK